MTRALAAVALALAVAFACFSSALVAQTTGTSASSELDYDSWDKIAARAEEALAAARASNGAFETLREELVDWRSLFQAEQSINQSRISTLQSQLAALGDPPDDGSVEDVNIVSRRAALDAQLATLRAPVLRADEAYNQADGLIGEIDTLLRSRQTETLTRLGPVPVNPAYWPEAASDFGTTISDFSAEIASNATRSGYGGLLRANSARILVYALSAIFLIGFAPRWMMALLAQGTQSMGVRLQNVLTFIGSLVTIILPYLGLIALIRAVQATELLGLLGTSLSAMVPKVGLVILVALWLGRRIAPKNPQRLGLLTSDAINAATARWAATGLGIVIGVAALIGEVAAIEGYSDASLAVLRFPVLLLGGVMLFRLGRKLTLAASAEVQEEQTGQIFRNRLLRILGRATMLVALLGPVVGAIGMSQLASFLIFSSISTLGVLAAVALLQGFVSDIYGLIMGQPEDADTALTPVLIGFALSLWAVPVLALIWGARVTDLTELWTKFTAGFSIGESRISPADFMYFALVFAIGYLLTRLVQGTLRSTILPRTDIDPGAQSAIVSGLGYLGIFLAAVISISAAGIDLSSLAIVAGALSVGIGFGLQNIVSNFVSGIILLIERPVTEGDWIEVGGVMGTVRDISVRSTRVETFDRTDVIVPNSDLISGHVTNWTRHNLNGRLIIKVGVAYGTDTRAVETVLREIANAHPLVTTIPAPQILFVNFGGDSLDFEVRVILRNVNRILEVQSDLHHEIAKRFSEEGFEIPFAQRDLWLRNPEVLRNQGTSTS